DDALERARAAASVLRVRGRAHDAACVHEWSRLEVSSAGASSAREMPVAALAGAKVVSACALGNPSHFHRMAELAGARVVARLEKADHRPFAAHELEQAARRAEAQFVLMSRKDRVKLDRALEVEVAVPALSLRFVEGEAAVRDVLARLVSERCARA
ncbi:MAG: tetraacyldisaccharide 4'-kinase, partial [Phycisphaerales bacterium]